MMDRIQLLSILGSALLLAVVLELVRSRKLKEEYSLLWILTGSVLLGLSIWRGLLDRIAHLAGIHYPPSALFLVGFGFFLLIFLHYSIVLSDLSERTKRLTREIALLREKEARDGQSGDTAE
ncbi:MAG: DUF2304 domain-containing protein [Gemmatimonadota bacterium]|jgi:hypothetical protein|nr:DUF2304 domain-containing protein [Gemmatimonadota bacterium]MDP6803486.1 DUF2304 domain-containing protein [Gemmatimonadota bacterium]MDP7031709.1 DUF2304 domain-containing protein [Gemmatimonadota bacterium]